MGEIIIEINLLGRKRESLDFLSNSEARRSYLHEVSDKIYDELFRPEPEPFVDIDADHLFSARARWDARNRRRDEYIRMLSSQIAYSLMDSFRTDKQE